MCSEGKIPVFSDKEDAENPMDREEVKESVKLADLKSYKKILTELAAGPLEGMTIARVPVVEERPQPEDCFDMIIKALVEENPAKTQCIFSSQLGQGRTTFGMTVACIVKAVQMSSKLNKMVDTGIGSRDWADGIIKKTFEELADSEDLKDHYLMGEFEVVKELLEKMPEAKDGKQLADKMIDLCGVPPEGTGIQNLRKCIIKTKYKYDAATEDRQSHWKKMIINFIERYFYLICFATYAKKFGPDGFKKSFKDWMNENSSLRDMIANGKDKLEWSRKVDQGAVNVIQGLITGDNFKDKMGEVVTKLYKISHTTYADMPRGVIKVRFLIKVKIFFIADVRVCIKSSRKMQKLLGLLEKQDIFAAVMLKVFIVSGHTDEKADLQNYDGDFAIRHNDQGPGTTCQAETVIRLRDCVGPRPCRVKVSKNPLIVFYVNHHIIINARYNYNLL